MFGSLVVVFPTTHEGGALVLREDEKEWTFDSGQEISEQTKPSIGYVAFYSDVEHEVTLVKSGHRVTLTYNLCFTDNESSATVASVTQSELAFKEALSDILADDRVLPEGGTLGFGLRHEYPIKPKTPLQHVLPYLKGSDAIIQRVCAQLSLALLVNVVYHAHDYDGKKISCVVPSRISATSVRSTTLSRIFCRSGVVEKLYDHQGTTMPKRVWKCTGSPIWHHTTASRPTT
jgi:hypothetical protein